MKEENEHYDKRRAGDEGERRGLEGRKREARWKQMEEEEKGSKDGGRN